MKVGRMVVFGAGYLLGSKAGRERYDQLLQLARKTNARIQLYNSEHQKERSGDSEAGTFYDLERR